jgi:hypothetical protein
MSSMTDAGCWEVAGPGEAIVVRSGIQMPLFFSSVGLGPTCQTNRISHHVRAAAYG